MAVRYNATRCLRYFMDAKRVQEDLQTLLVKCPLFATSYQGMELFMIAFSTIHD